MIINIGDIEKVGITHAIRVAMSEISELLKSAFSNCLPDKNNVNWYRWVEDRVDALKELKQLLDRIEEREDSSAKGEVK